jgi:putative sigma-54 modulation protein
MNTDPSPESIADRVIVRGIHLELTAALRQAAIDKTECLLRHKAHLIRIRIDLALDQARGAKDSFIAKGRVEIRGPDLIASVQSDNAYKSLDLLMDKLDELLRRRHQMRVNVRNDKRKQAPGILHGEK